MTSQKRYRQHQESNKNNSRFRDLPPRFKRQKSAVSAAPLPSDSASPVPAETQQDTVINHPAAVRQTDSPQPVKSPIAMAPSTHVYPVEDSPSAQLRSRTDVFQTPQVAVSTAASWQWPAKADTVVLSQWDNRQFNRASNIHPPHIALGTRFGYKLDSPPLSPWACGQASNFTGQFGMAGSPTWMSPASDLCTGQGIHSPPVYFNNENWAPNQNVLYPHSPGGSWGKPSVHQHLYKSPSPFLQDEAPLSARHTENSASVGSSIRPQIDYTDPDIRTIEMLRELERVADEKESEDFGVDRKSLVSHHLRMLMCAVDKYTEGIEDGITEASRHDEVSSANGSCESTPPNSPGPYEAKEKQTKMNTKEAKTMWPQGREKSTWNNSEVKLASPAARQVVHIHGHKSPLQQTSLIRQQPNSIESPTAAWDLWSSPSFDFSGLLNQNLDDLTRNPFSRFKENDEKERKPLYQR